MLKTQQKERGERLRLLYRTLPIIWNSSMLCSLRVTASRTSLALDPPEFFLRPLPPTISTTQENWRAIIALRISPLDVSIMMSSVSLDGADPVDFEKWVVTSVWRAFFIRVGAMGLNL